MRALQERRWSHRRPVPTGVISVVTLAFWGVWIYLVLPVLTAVMWFFGVRMFTERMSADGYDGLQRSLLSYSAVLLALVALLAIWIAWNVIRYGGANDRRTVKRPDPTPEEVSEAFRVDGSLLDPLQQARLARVDVDRQGCIVVVSHQ